MNSINKTARIAGALYLLLLPLGIFSLLYVPAAFIVPDDMVATANNILANESIFRLSIVSALLLQIVNLFVVFYLYKLLKPVNKSHAQLMVIFILVAAPIAMLNEVNQLAILYLLNEGAQLTSFTTAQIQALVAFFLHLHESGIVIAQLFWGLWLFPMGYLVFRSNYIPKIIGILLMIGCVGYLLDSLPVLLWPTFGMTFSQFTFWGELILPLWLLIKGVNVEQWQKQALESA
jgi:hypothetical protein